MKMTKRKQGLQFGERFLWPMVLSVIFLMILVSVAMAATKQPQPKKQTKAADAIKPQYGGIFRSALSADPRSLDPHMEVSVGTTLVTTNTYNNLLRFNPEMTGWELDLAKSMKQIDDTTYEFKIHQGVFFQNIPPVNGRELTSEDVKYSIERMAGVHGRKNDFKHNWYFAGKIKSIETPDKYTIIFKTIEPYASFLRHLSSPWCAIVPKEVVDKFGDLKTRAIGTGPFILKEWVKGSHFTLVKNPGYWKKGLPFVDGIHFKVMPDPSSVLSAFIAGRLDGTSTYHQNIETIKKAAPDTVIETFPSVHMFVLRIQPWIEGEKPLKPPFDNKKVRQALAMSIDKKKLLKLAMGGHGRLGIGPIPPVLEYSLKESDQVKFNPQMAKKLLAEAGYPNGFSVELLTWNLPYMTAPVQVIQKMLKDVGIEAKLTLLELAQYLNRAYRFDYDLSFHVTTAGVDPEDWLTPYFGQVNESTVYKWSNPEIWKMIKKQSNILDVKKRKALIRNIQLKLLEDSPFVCLYTPIRFSVRKPYVHALKRYKLDYQPLYGEYLWMEKH
ncbi:MAG: ABC transporter substrate-binding protein [Deltaproteobacteria bacterium]|nr:ABC transporter substrate-binding protein [Deltaproteobacteria bacterium]